MKRQQLNTSLRRIGWVGGILLIIIIITAAVERKRTLPIAATEVVIKPLKDGVFLVDSLDVIKMVERSFGMRLDEQAAGLIDAGRLERVLEEDLFIKNAEVALTANSRIKILIEQRQPILRITDNTGAQYYLDEEGRRVPLSKHFTARTLIATGNIVPHTPEFLSPRLNHPMKDLFALTQFLLADKLWAALFEQIYVNARNEFVLVPKIGEHVVVVGKWDEDIADKFDRLRIFYREGLSREGWQKYHTIDLRYRNQVVCSRR